MTAVREAIMAHGPAAVRALNATTTGDLTFEDRAVDMARFDRFPAELRYRLATNNTKPACLSLEAHAKWAMRQFGGVSRTIARVNKIEQNDLEVFAGQYFGQYGTKMPHIAAEATFLRYGMMGPSRHPPKAFGRDIYRVPPGPRRRRRR